MNKGIKMDILEEYFTKKLALKDSMDSERIDFEDFRKNPIKHTIQNKHNSKALVSELKKIFPKEYNK
jgi:hypothetical protein